MSDSAQPTEPSDVIATVRHQYDGLTPSQKRIAEGIVDDLEFVAFATVDKMAAKLGVSPSTVVRFAYRLGLEGYHDLQARIRIIVRSQIRSSQDGSEIGALAHLSDSPLGESVGRDLEQLTRTASGLDPVVFDQVVKALEGARRVFVSGDVTSYSVAYFFALALDRARGGTRLVRADGEGAGRVVDMDESDAVIAFTFPPYSRSVLKVVDLAVERGARTVGVTDRAISPVGQRVEFVLPTLVAGLGPQNTLVPAMAVANALVNGLILSDADKAMTRYGAVNHVLHDWDVYVLRAEDDD